MTPPTFPVLQAFAIYSYQLAQNTAGGTATSGSWITYPLNTEVSDPNNLGTISSSQVTLVPGTYYVWAACLFQATNSAQIRLFNVTDSVVMAGGIGTAPIVGAADQHPANLMVQFTITTAKVLRIEYQVQTTKATVGLGLAANFTTEVYGVVSFQKIG